MVKRVIKLVYSEVRGLHQAAYVLGLFAFGSQLLALVRDRMLAHQFGAGSELDLYYAAFRVPDLLYVLFASTLSVYVLIPFITVRQHNEDGEGARYLLSQVFSYFLKFYILLAAVIFFAVPYITPVLFPGLTEDTNILNNLIRVLLLQPLLLGISSLFGVVTQLGHRFVLYAVSPLIYNIGIIAGIVFFYPMFGLYGLVMGVVLGALGHMLIQLPMVRGSALAFSFQAKSDNAIIKKVLAVSIPRAVTLAMHQVVLLVFVSVASVMAVGSVSVFQFAYNLQAVPLAIIGASYSIAAFPVLADLYSSDKMDKFRASVISALRHIMFWSIPVIGLIIVLRAQMVRVVLGSGEFNWSDTKLTAAVLAILVVSLVAQAINLLVVRTFYASGHTKTPFFVTLFGSVLAVLLLIVFYNSYDPNSSFSHIFVSLMRLDSVPGSEVLLLAVAYSTALITQTGVMLLLAARRYQVSLQWMFRHLFHTLSASMVGAMAAYVTLNSLESFVNQDTFSGIFLQGLVGGIAGIAGVIAAYALFGTKELKEVARSFKVKIFKDTEVVTAQDDIV